MKLQLLAGPANLPSDCHIPCERWRQIDTASGVHFAGNLREEVEACVRRLANAGPLANSIDPRARRTTPAAASKDIRDQIHQGLEHVEAMMRFMDGVPGKARARRGEKANRPKPPPLEKAPTGAPGATGTGGGRGGKPPGWVWAAGVGTLALVIEVSVFYEGDPQPKPEPGNGTSTTEETDAAPASSEVAEAEESKRPRRSNGPPSRQERQRRRERWKSYSRAAKRSGSCPARTSYPSAGGVPFARR